MENKNSLEQVKKFILEVNLNLTESILSGRDRNIEKHRKNLNDLIKLYDNVKKENQSR